MDISLEEMISILEEKIAFSLKLISDLDPVLDNIDGVAKLQRKIRRENEFLQKLLQTRKVKKEHLNCSNLRHLGSMVEYTLKPGVVAVCKVFHINDDTKLLVDIVSEEGKRWTKVIARNPKSLSALSSGKSSYGARSTLDQARDYLECAKLYPCMFQSPKVIFAFVSGIEERLAKKLKSLGVIVNGEIYPNSCDDEIIDDESSSDSDDELNECCDNEELINFTNCSNPCEGTPLFFANNVEIANECLNLDVTTLMAYISNMTNGHCNYVFKQEVLTQQCRWEAETPVKPILEKLFKDKKLICCETAWKDFEKIVNILGGDMEKKRCEELKSKLTILPDDFAGEDDYPRRNLKVRGHVRTRSKTIFNFGHRMKALTVSANEGFLRAAKQQGVTYAAFIHESRALTEGKESTATKF